MTICDEGHEEVVYEGDYCPMCEANTRIEDLEERIEELEERIEDLEGEVEKLEGQITNY